MFYTECEGRLLTDSSLAKLLQRLTIKPNFNRTYLEQYLLRGVCFRYPSQTETLYQGIYRVPHGHRLEVLKGHVRVSRVESIQAGEHQALSWQATQRQFKAYLLSAVRQCLPHQGVLALELSGGLDSSVVSALARECCPDALLYAFSNVIPEVHNIPLGSLADQVSYRFDETAFSKPVAQHLRLHQKLIGDQQGFAFHAILEHYTEILGSFSEVSFPILNYRTYEQAQQLGVSTLLSGFGGDEMVSQHARFYLRELKEHYPAWRYRYEQVRSMSAAQWLARLGLKPRLSKANNLLMPTEHWAFLQPALLNARQPAPTVDFPNQQAYELALVEGALATHFDRRIETSTLIAAHYGIAMHFPLTNPRLMQFFHSLPVTMKRRHGMGRYLLRKTMQSALPRDVVWRQDKDGRTAPAANAAFMRQLPALFAERIGVHYQGLLADYVDIPKLRAYLQKPGNGQHSSIFRLSIMVMMFDHLEKWLARQF